LNIRPKETLVITRCVGSGKSTFIQLLLIILQPLSEKIEIQTTHARVPITQVKEKLLDYFEYVGPDPFLIEGTVRENLMYGLKNIPSEKEIFDALKMPHCHFLAEQGIGLSAGQKHQLSFARALLRNPTVLILDEATAFFRPTN